MSAWQLLICVCILQLLHCTVWSISSNGCTLSGGSYEKLLKFNTLQNFPYIVNNNLLRLYNHSSTMLGFFVSFKVLHVVQEQLIICSQEVAKEGVVIINGVTIYVQLIWDRALGLPIERPKSMTFGYIEDFCKAKGSMKA